MELAHRSRHRFKFLYAKCHFILNTVVIFFCVKHIDMQEAGIQDQPETKLSMNIFFGFYRHELAHPFVCCWFE